jgi:hypothetical protein
MKCKVAGPVVNGEPDIIHDDDSLTDALDIKAEQDKCMNNKNPEEFEPEPSGDDKTEHPEEEPDPDTGEDRVR